MLNRHDTFVTNFIIFKELNSETKYHLYIIYRIIDNDRIVTVCEDIVDTNGIVIIKVSSFKSLHYKRFTQSTFKYTIDALTTVSRLIEK
jgi:hypothetical protein